MANEKILYEQKQVVIKERSTQTDLRVAPLEDVTGTLTLVENGRGKFFRFVPLGVEDVMNDDWALINGGHSVVSPQSPTDSNALSSSPLLKYRFHFNLNDLRSVRRHHMLHGLAHMVFILNDGTTLPAFHFMQGGSKALLQQLAQYLKLEKSEQDSRLYIVKDDLPTENATASISLFDQLNLFDNSNDISKRWRGTENRRSAIDHFSKVTYFLRDTILGQDEVIMTNDHSTDLTTPTGLTTLMESVNGDLKETNNDGFEVIYKVDFKKDPQVDRGEPLTMKEWQNSFDKDGRIIDEKALKSRIFRGGLESNELRREAWKFLLNYYPWTSTREERLQLSKQRKSEYHSMKLQWKSMSDQQKERNTTFRDRESLIMKDVARTDRNLDYYQGDDNMHLRILHDVLMTYNMFNFDLGYVQGMNDLLSPILIIMEDEVDAFWTFAGLMSRMEPNFHLDQAQIKRQLSNLYTLLQFIDAELAKYLADNNANNMYFFFRWILICFKREFPFDDVMTLWEVLWTDELCENFELLICLAILISQRTLIMESKFGCTEILKFFNDLSCNIDLDTCLVSAEKMYIQLATHRDIPTSIARILGLTNRPKPLKISHSEPLTFPRKIYTNLPRGTMNLDNSYFRQESEPSLIPNPQRIHAELVNDQLLMTPIFDV